MPTIILMHSLVLQPIYNKASGGGNLFEGWTRLIYLLPRFLLYFVCSSQAPSPNQYKTVALALLVEIIFMTFGGWMFGRSIM